MEHRTRLGVIAVALWAALLVVGCDGDPRQPATTGSARIAAVLGATPDPIARVTVTVTGGSLTSPLVQDLSPMATGWAGTVSLLPVGAGYTCSVEAFGAGAAGPPLYRGAQTHITIAAGQTATVAITLLEVNPTPGPTSKMPIIAGLSASATNVAPGTLVHVHVTAFSPEGHALAYLWQSTCGSLAGATQPGSDWTAGEIGGPCSLSVRVSDATNATSVTAYLVMLIQETGGVDLTVTVNAHPIVTIAVEQHLVTSPGDPSGLPVGNSAVLIATGTDPDGEAVTYDWPSEHCGGFEGSSYSSPVLHFHVADPRKACTLTLTVSDTRGAATTAVVELSRLGQRTAFLNAGALSSLVIDEDGTLWVWGSYLQLSGPYVPLYEPMRVGEGFASVATRTDHTLGLRTDGTLWAWGDNEYGTLGDGTTESRSYPGVQVGAEFATATAGTWHSVAVETDGTLWAWGLNYTGQLGDGTTTARLVPVQIGSGFASVAAGATYTVAVKTDGTLWAWGDNEYGQLGDGTTTDRLAPVQVGSGFASVAAGINHTVAVKTDGTLWAWGYNAQGQLGDGTTTDRYAPVQIDSGIALAAAGGYHTLAVKTDGTLWAWGLNDRGQLGDCTTLDRLEPTWVGSGYASVAAGYHSLAVKTDGTLWTWGENGYGQLGDGTRIDRHTPGLLVLPP